MPVRAKFAGLAIGLPLFALAGAATSVKIPKYQYVGFDFPILDEMW